MSYRLRGRRRRRTAGSSPASSRSATITIAIARWYGSMTNVDAERRATLQLAFFAELGERLTALPTLKPRSTRWSSRSCRTSPIGRWSSLRDEGRLVARRRHAAPGRSDAARDDRACAARRRSDGQGAAGRRLRRAATTQPVGPFERGRRAADRRRRRARRADAGDASKTPARSPTPICRSCEEIARRIAPALARRRDLRARTAHRRRRFRPRCCRGACRKCRAALRCALRARQGRSAGRRRLVRRVPARRRPHRASRSATSSAAVSPPRPRWPRRGRAFAAPRRSIPIRRSCSTPPIASSPTAPRTATRRRGSGSSIRSTSRCATRRPAIRRRWCAVPTGRSARCDGDGLPLGLAGPLAQRRSSYSTFIEPGSVLLLFTDGLIESARDALRDEADRSPPPWP